MAKPKSHKKGKPPVKEAAAVKPRRETYVVAGICVALVVACFAIYGQTLGFGFINYDDDLYVTDNPPVQAGLNLKSMGWAFVSETAHYFHPLTWMSHMLDCSLYGMNAHGHHLTNLLFHAADSVLLFLALKLLTRSLWPSAAVAALFAVHPLHVESVAWIAERKDVLSAFFWMLALGAYGLYARRPGIGRYAVVAIMFVLGLMSKPMMVTLPCALLLLDYWPLGRFGEKWAGFSKTSSAPPADVRLKAESRFWKNRPTWLIIEKIPLFLLTLAGSAATMIMQERGGNLAYGSVVTLSSRIANAAVAYVVYLMKMFSPFGLAVFYPHPISRPWWQPAAAAVILLVITAGAAASWRRRPYLIVGWLWYLGTLVPVIELVQAGTFAYADRYTYIPSIGIFIMVAWGLADLVSVPGSSPLPGASQGPRRGGSPPAGASYPEGKHEKAAWRAPRWAVATASCVALALLTFCAGVQTSYWHDSLTLFRHALDVTDNNYQAHCNIGDVLGKEQGRLQDAIVEYKKAIALYPNHRGALNNCGNATAMLGKPAEAEEYFKKALALEETPDVYINLGNTRAQLGKYDDAIDYYHKALRLNPNAADAYSGLGYVFSAQGKLKEAATEYEHALRLKPGNRGARQALDKIKGK